MRLRLHKLPAVGRDPSHQFFTGTLTDLSAGRLEFRDEVVSRREQRIVKATQTELMELVEQQLVSLLRHDGFGDMRIEIRLLKRGQKEVIVHCGKQYRFVVDSPAGSRNS